MTIIPIATNLKVRGSKFSNSHKNAIKLRKNKNNLIPPRRNPPQRESQIGSRNTFKKNQHWMRLTAGANHQVIINVCA